MSLNGLDDAKVIEAHEVATTEPGGWFLLKYANRDEVELLDHGSGGIVDVRGAIAKYEEASPLYGFLKYRRRIVLLKYQPEDCSRLIQARAAVHFNAVCERFAPYDITFEISVAKDLKDSKLSAACSLHTASGSACSSSSSLRRRRLNEIAEEEEEEERERKRQSTVKEEDKRASSVYSVPAHSPPIARPTVLDSQQISAPQETSFTSTANVPEFTGADRPTSPTLSESAPRLSSQSTRPDLYGYATYTYGKPKVKLGPRPSLDTNKRPSTAENFRPTAALPAGFKLFSKGTKKGQSQDMEHVEKTEEAEGGVALDTALAPSKPIPEVPQGTGLPLPPRPATSSGASIKLTTQSLAPPPTKEVKITPEKARLMKAMKLREKKKMMTTTTTPEQTAPLDIPPPGEEKEGCDTESKDSLRIKGDTGHRAVSNADSGIAIDPPTPMTINTEDTSYSRPNSPTGGTSSEIGASTKASSLSESTDEIVQASKDIRKEAEEVAPRDLPGMEDGLEQTKTNTDVLDAKNTEVSQKSQEGPNHPTQTTEHSLPSSVEADGRTDIISPPNSKGNEQPPSEEDTPKSPWRLPVSKFSSNEPQNSAEQKSPTAPRLKSKFSIPDISLPAEPVPALPNTSVEYREQTGGESFSKAASEITIPPKSAKRRTVVGTIRTDLTKTTPHSESSDPLLDDALMEELQSATLQEAKPMLVSKSPITPVFPNPSSVRPGPPLSRAVSNPMRGPLLAPSDVSQSSARSVSAGGAALLHNITRQSSNAGLQAKKNNLGSSISQRIKALEKLSGPGGPEDVRPKTAAPSSAFFSVRRQSIREPPRPSSVLDHTGSPEQPAPTAEQSQERPKLSGAERRERSRSVASRLSMFEMPTQNSPRGRPDSIQVTARIVRDPEQSLPTQPEVNASPSDYPQLELKQSPLIVDLQRPELSQPVPEPVPTPLVQVSKETIQERRDKKSNSDDGEKKHRRSSLSIVKDFIKDRRTSTASKSTDNLAKMSPNGSKSPSRPPSTHQTSGGFARRLSISSRRSSFSRERENSIGSPAVLSDSGSGDDDKKSDKKSETRASRFMRRLSNSLNGNRKVTSPHISPTVAEEDADQLAAPTTNDTLSSQPAVVAYMGDVNVQFPDNLLWKRRSMALDTQGFLFLSAIQGAAVAGKDKAVAAGAKRYHLSDFRAPYIPDVEIQELPNSVVLDLVEGSCLQIACEDRAGQLNILQALQDAHQSHSSFRQ
ncbi:hypothetical protein F5Y00DRAFT_22250 [Daldinia vernicosa]|uniref:uncharacterized protein n=1 Tax=Daldinia vernicosa TaxID=114800 RepID=UPI0020077D4D|nr:uncharacterized protein F5Y00DRAFT_22250 [Daldinia vernicosa]KAI0850925.1 hypothetical protein F5Y00DRAFT_22250 [Daldinia vernicosa]